MRLIDADELIKGRVENDPVRIAAGCAPTAYNIDKVIEQLKDHAIEFELFGQCNDYVEISHAIEIIKKGGTKW